MNEKQRSLITEYTIKLIENTIKPEEFESLNSILGSSQEAARHYNQLMRILNAFQESGNEIIKDDLSETVVLRQEFWHLLREVEQTAPAIAIPRKEPTRDPVQKIICERVPSRVNKLSLATAIFCAAALLFLLLFIHIDNLFSGPEVATLADSLHARWSSADSSMQKGMRLGMNRSPLVLQEGLAELHFDNGARIVVEGPAEFQISAEDRIRLGYGRLFARVPREAIGFTVKTFSAQIVDLGTEFGVDCGLHGDTSLHVLKGKTVLIAGDKFNKGSVEVTGGAAKKVSAATRIISDISCNDRLFVREIDSAGFFIWRGETRISLADIVGGGNGFGTGITDSGIETNTGRWFESPDPELAQGNNDGILSGGGSYNRVSRLACIDGVFVPDSREGPVQITSAGHTFDGFADGREVFWGNIYNGAWHASDTSIKHQLRLNGQTYGTRDNPAISIHSNQGITFDLQAIRQSIPGGSILRFTSLFGVSETMPLDPFYSPKADGLNSGKVNCWVLIDGDERFNRNSITYLQGATEIEIEIRDQDRFLTLVVTESGDRRAYDWALFAKPSLLIEMNTD